MATAPTSFSTSKYFWCTKDRLGNKKTSLVFAGHRRDNGSRVAVKMFASVDFRALQREIRAVETIGHHENIVKLIDVDEETITREKVVVMELCTGGSLMDILESPENGYGLNEEDFKQVISDVAKALEYLRSINFAHRDIKPQNIMKHLRPDGTSVYKLADFGTARELEDDQPFKSFYGTQAYLHPAMHEKGVASAKVDLWSVGATYFHTATGREPFRSKDQQLTQDIASKKPPGALYGWQLDSDGDIQYGMELPPDIRIPRGLRALIEPVLAKLLERDLQKMISFENFFQSIRAIVQMKVVDVFCVYSCSIHKVYVDPEEADGVQALKRMIHKQTGVDPVIQELFYENLPYSPRELIAASKLPNTTEDSPILVFGGPILKVDLEKPLLPTIPQVPKGCNMTNDIQFGKECCKSMWAFRFAAENLDQQYKLMRQVALCYSHAVKHELLELEWMLSRVEHVDGATCKVLTSQIAGLNRQAQLISYFLPSTATSNLFSLLKQEIAAKETALHKIQGVLPPLKQKINNQIKVEASTVPDMWDPQLSRDVFHRCIDTLQNMVQCADCSYESIRRKVNNRNTFEPEAHELTKSELHETLRDAQKKVNDLTLGKEKVHRHQGEGIMKCISLRNDIRNVFEKLHAHFEDCNRHLLDLEKWEKVYDGRLKGLQDNLSLSQGNSTMLPQRQHLQPEPTPYPNSQAMSDLQKATGECSKTVALQQMLLGTLTDLIKSLSDVATITDQD